MGTNDESFRSARRIASPAPISDVGEDRPDYPKGIPIAATGGACQYRLRHSLLSVGASAAMHLLTFLKFYSLLFGSKIT
jgi:hypothetical protein